MGMTEQCLDHWMKDAIAELQFVSQTVNNDSLLQLLLILGYRKILILVIASLWGTFYLFLSPLFDVLEYVLRLVLPLRRYSNYKKSNQRSFGLISQRVDSKTGRTYVTRYYNPERDFMDCCHLIASAFHTDPTMQYLQPNAGLRHLYGHYWYPCQLSLSNDIIIEEWQDKEKVVGVSIFSQREHGFISDVIDLSKFMANAIRFLFLDYRTCYRQVRLALAKECKIKSICDILCLKNLIELKFLVVERGFEGQGIGTHLMNTVLDNIDELDRPVYLESSSIKNVPFYTQLGFQPIEVWKWDSCSPPMYLMYKQRKES